MHAVKVFRFDLAQPLLFHANHAKAGFLNEGQDRAGLSGGHGVWFDDCECAFHRFDYVRFDYVSIDFTFAPISAGVGQTTMPASAIAAILSSARPEPPDMIAP